MTFWNWTVKYDMYFMLLMSACFTYETWYRKLWVTVNCIHSTYNVSYINFLWYTFELMNQRRNGMSLVGLVTINTLNTSEKCFRYKFSLRFTLPRNRQCRFRNWTVNTKSFVLCTPPQMMFKGQIGVSLSVGPFVGLSSSWFPIDN
jgi:hypothetical protein